jgi:glycosyltransferase involved in cell wall biosynthesis
MPILSILIPVYNEEAFLAQVVERIQAVELPDTLQKEIVIVNDHSTDQTKNVIQNLCNEFPNVRAFDQPVNQGKGAAIRRAIDEMTGDFAIIQDADLEYAPEEYPLLLQPLLEVKADVVYGSRFANRDVCACYSSHVFGNKLLTCLSNRATGLKLSDMETCYKVFRADILKSIPLRSNRFGMEPEITAKVAKRGLRVVEVPISYRGRNYNEGKKIGWKDGVSAIWTIAKYWFLDDSVKRG